MTNEDATKTTAKFSEADAAAILNCTVKQLRSRMAALGYVKPCGRCGGGGRYSYCQQYGTKCFGCAGSGKVLMPVTKGRAIEAKSRVDAGELVTYFARIEETRKAKAAIAPLVAELEALAKPIGDEYGTGSRDGGMSPDEFITTPLFYAQSMAGAIRYGSQRGERPTDPVAMSASEIESAVRFSDLGYIVAAREMSARVEMMRALRAAWDAR